LKGISVAPDPVDVGLYYPIVLGPDKINLGYHQLPRGLPDKQLLDITDQALDTFAEMEEMIVARDTIHLDANDARRALKALACWGWRTYYELFSSDAQKLLRLYEPRGDPDSPPWRPTFISEEVPFLWELLYDGKRYQDGDPNMFWGFRSAPARVLDLRRDNFQYAAEQALPSDMLFCLHQRLRQAHLTEWPEIEQLVRATTEDHFFLLGASTGPPNAV
jgi:hypothetical protein